MAHQFTIACSKNNLTSIREFITEHLEEIGLRTIDLNLIVLAIDEVCANLIIHSNKCDQEKKLEIFFDYDIIRQQLQVNIKDQGQLFEYKKYSEPNIKDLIKSRKKGGIGLLLVRKIMDRIEYSTDNFHNVTKLSKKISPQSLAS